MSRRPSLSTLVPLTAIALVAGACGTSPDAALTTVAPATVTPTAVVSASSPIPPSVATPETPPPTTEPTPTPSTEPVLVEATDPSTSTASTVDGAVPTLPNGEPVPGLSPDGPWTLVDGAPGVQDPGFVYELLPKLWVFLPTEESDDDGNLFVPSPADIPIIEAYVLGIRAYNAGALAGDPSTIDDQLFVDPSAMKSAIQERTSGGARLDLGAGVVRRPHVIGDGRSETEAIIFDCVLDGSVFRNPDGSLAPGSRPGVAPLGISSRLVMVGGAWQIVTVSNQVEACA